ncbi:disintegrin and metalloproteinase domain-containing protein 32 [Erethizon dorsatum]
MVMVMTPHNRSVVVQGRKTDYNRKENSLENSSEISRVATPNRPRGQSCFLLHFLMWGCQLGFGGSDVIVQYLRDKAVTQDEAESSIELQGRAVLVLYKKTYVIPIDEKPYTVHLKQRYFLGENFMVYMYNQGSVSASSSDIQPQCYYQGSIEGHLGSVATLTTCSGLRGILQFENVSYGIEPLESAVDFQHILYKLGTGTNELGIFKNNNRNIEKQPMDYTIFIDEKIMNEKISPTKYNIFSEWLQLSYLPLNAFHKHYLGVSLHPCARSKVEHIHQEASGPQETLKHNCLGASLEPPPLTSASHTKDLSIILMDAGEAESQALDLFPLYLEMHIVVDKALCDYLGSDSTIITKKVMETINLVNSVFIQLKVTVVLSSLELWSDKNKISTVGEAHELLQKFLDWKQSYLTLRPHDVAYLFIYRDHPDYMGITFPGKMCVNLYSTGVVLYSKDITLEAFSVIVIQMLGLSLGIAYDDPLKCQCSEAICIMTPDAIQSTGAKTFSNCSLNDFRSFMSNVGARCLQNKPQMQRNPRPVCGNGIVEGNETCDCGTEQFLQAGTLCRPMQHPECDIPEYCNGTSEQCVPDVFIKNGHQCKNNSFICYNGDCHDLDARCESYFGEGSKNAPFACYEEVNAQVDMFGNCGKSPHQYRLCGWRNLICARLICTYPFQTPYIQPSISVIYAYVRNNICISLFNTSSPKGHDPFVVKSGAECDIGRVCVNRVCVESRMIKDASYLCTKRCNGHGVCNSKDECNCTDGYLPPNCQAQSRGWSGEEGLIITKASGKARKNWLLSFYTGLPVLIIVSIIAVAWNSLKKWFTKDEESLGGEYKSEGSTNTYVSSSPLHISTALPLASGILGSDRALHYRTLSHCAASSQQLSCECPADSRAASVICSHPQWS